MAIKLKCKCCGEYSTRKEWNKKTSKEWDGEIFELFTKGWKDCKYTCPKCGADTDGKDFLKEGDSND